MRGLHRRTIAVLMMLSACGAEALPIGSTTTGFDTAPSTTAAPAVVTTPATTEPMESAPPAAEASDLTVHQVLLRYDGALTLGTVELTLCNFGRAEGVAARVTIEIDGAAFDLPPPGVVSVGTCMDVFDPAASFPDYGIDAPGAFTVTAAVTPTDPADDAANDMITEKIWVERLEPRAADLGAYASCVALTGTFVECYTRVPFDVMDDPHEVGKGDGDSMAIVPAEYELLAAWIVADNRRCVTSLSNYFGVELGRYSQRVVETPVQTSFPVFAFGPTIIAVEAVRETLLASVSDLPAAWEGIRQGWCWNSHELTHLFLGMTPIPGWLDEGLASYMSEPFHASGFGQFTGTNAGPVPPPALEPHETIGCRITGFDLTVGGSSNFYRFEDLDAPDYDPLARGLYYATGACFWDHIATTYGGDAVARIVQRLIAVRSPQYESCTPEFKATAFLRDFVEPVIGEDISALTEERFGFGLLWNGCEP